MPTRNGFPRMQEVFLLLCEDVNSPLSLGLYLRFKYDQKSLAEFEFDPSVYNDIDTFEADYFVASYLSKYKGLVTGIDQSAVAIQKFDSSEALCRETNDRIKKFRRGQLAGPSVEFFIAKRKIAELLGPFSIFSLEPGVGWGPGATVDLRRREAALDMKISKVPISVTREALPTIRNLISNDLHWASCLLCVNPEDLVGPFSFLPHLFNIVDANKVDLVPKNAKTHRVIAKEPRANAFLQKGYGSFIRKRLKCVGIDLEDQGKNQEGALRAYTDSLSTLDLKAASDSMSTELVYELLPIDWALALDDLRSKRSVLPDGKKITLEKFSSMGNGFTFELETLLFWALASAVKELKSVGGEILVYGDDIIVPREIAPDVVELLRFAGFQTNKDKSFIDGNFFESCGEHFFKGIQCTPVYQKEVIDSVEELIRSGNRLRRLALRFRRNGRLWPVVRRAWYYIYSHQPSSRRFQLPQGVEGDDGWLVDGELFNAVSQDLNMGLRCRVVLKPTRVYPGHELALLSWFFRRGSIWSPDHISSSEPSYGNVEFPPGKNAPLREGRRWVMPNGDFGQTW